MVRLRTILNRSTPSMHFRIPHPPAPRGPTAAGPDRRALRDRLACCLCGDEEGNTFLHRRTLSLVAALPDEGERRILSRALTMHDRPEACAQALLAWAGHLEDRGRFDEAEFATDLAARRAPDDPALDLHRARIARKAGHAEKALRHYLRTLERTEERDTALARMARLGCVLVSPEGERGITEILRESVRSGDAESAAVAQEARARRRIGVGDTAGAIRDLLMAAARYPQRIDRGRVGLDLADLLLARGDRAAATVVLEEVRAEATPPQAAAAQSRLWRIARAEGDQVGMRRWAGTTDPAALVALLPSSRARRAPSRAPRLRAALRRIRGVSGDAHRRSCSRAGVTGDSPGRRQS